MSRQNCPHQLLSAGICALILLNGCTTQIIRPESQRLAETLLIRAIRAEHKGDVKQAEALLKESLAVSTSIEDSYAKAMAYINLARLYRSGNHLAQASDNIDAALTFLDPGSAIYAEAAHEKALILFMTNSAEIAQQWAEKSVTNEKGRLLGRQLNLLGRIQLARNDLRSSVITLQKGLAENHSSGNTEEEANSLRMLGIIARKENILTNAERLLTEALEIDKRMAVSTKIAMDLEELSKTALAAGNVASAVRYLERAYDVHLSANRIRQASAAKKELAKIFSQQGNAEKADSARKTALELSNKVGIQQSNTPSDTIKPSNRP